MTTAPHFLLYGEHKIPFERALNQRGNKIRIAVQPSGRVIVFVPNQYNEAELNDFLQRKIGWIYKQRQTFSAQYVAPLQYVSGESHYYLGRKYQLKITQDLNTKFGVIFQRGFLHINTPSKDKAQVQSLLNTWYKQRAELIFRQRLNTLCREISWITDIPHIRCRQMQRQWGNCSADGVITLNTHLIKAPKLCIDYVIMHELCHLKEHNHSVKFYRLLASQMPQWQTVKQQLDHNSNLFCRI